MSDRVFDIGDQPVVTALFVDVDEQPADPSTVEVRVLRPDGTVFGAGTWADTDAEVTNTAVGTWKFTFPSPLDDDGVWRVRFAGTSAVVAADEIGIRVQRSRFS